ncbi:nucleoside triphosphate pyrophosphohydrolase [Mycobacterium tuberculosis]|nr:nucleoside triphosphate pyrophosphohydrolase [Mycobacterium tuberculosis]
MMIVVLVDPRRPTLVPVEAIEFLRGEVQYTEEMPVAVPCRYQRLVRRTPETTRRCCCRLTPTILLSLLDWPPVPG